MTKNRLALASVLLALAACGNGNTLEGSLGEIVDLAFEMVEVAQTPSAVSVSYLKPSGEGRDVVFKVVAYYRPEEIDPNTILDLAPWPDGEPQGACTRSVTDDPIHTFADIRRGSLVFKVVPVIQQPTHGEFRVLFGEGGDAGKGRTAFGTFDVPEVVQGS